MAYRVMNRQRLQQVLEAASKRGVAVAGDVMLDRFIYGRVSRISPEAPVPVVEVLRDTSHPGGAANVARNLAQFCKEVFICGRVGEDSGASELRRLLAEEGVRDSMLCCSSAFFTTVKTRVIARQQQVVRVDRERCEPMNSATLREMLGKLESIGDRLDALILEDYGKGFFTQESADAIASLFCGSRTILTADPTASNPIQWKGLAAVKPNRGEAFAAAGLPPSEPAPNPLEDRPLLEAGRILLEKWAPRHLLITLGEDGMLLFEQNRPPFHCPARAREVFDVSGAGDTAIALFTLALASGADPREAVEISTLASGIVVAKLGTATLTREELLARVS